MEYISKPAITDRIEMMYRKHGELYDAQQILCDIEDMTPADVRENTRGCWQKSYYDNVARTANCSKCGELLIFKQPGEKAPNFCPNCGADMRKEKRTAEEAEKKISLKIEDIEDGKGDYKLLPGFYEALAILRGEA